MRFNSVVGSFMFGVGLGYSLGRSSFCVPCTSIPIEPATSAVEKSTSSKSDARPNDSVSNKLIGKSVWDVAPFEHTKHVEFWPGMMTDTYNPFYHYYHVLGRYQPNQAEVFPELPTGHAWSEYFEAYHNHFHRFRGKKRVVFMEVGVQSGGKIPMLRDYFGPGFEYIGIDINPSTRMFDGVDWVSIEIGDSGNRTFLEGIVKKYPYVDIFLDDGGHSMQQQKLAIEIILPHLQSEGVFLCEDLSTTWGPYSGGVKNQYSVHPEFMEKTMVGLVHKSLDWLNAGWITGEVVNWKFPEDDFFDVPWWRVIPEQVKSIHYYNQIVVYEKGVVRKPQDIRTVGLTIPHSDSGVHDKVNWDVVLNQLPKFTESTWN